MDVGPSDRQRRRSLKIISLIAGISAAAVAYFIYLPMVEELKSMTEVIPAIFLRVLPVENWGILPYVVGVFYFLLVGMVVYWTSVLLMRIFAKKPASITTSRS